MPLPIKTTLPFHCHADFSITDNRRNIWKCTGDLTGESRFKARWNDRLIQYVIPELLASELELRKDYRLWPSLSESVFAGMLPHLVKLLHKKKVLHRCKTFITPENAMWIDPEGLGSCCELIKKICIEGGFTAIVDVPKHVRELLSRYNALTINNVFWLFSEILIPFVQKGIVNLLTALPVLLRFSGWVYVHYKNEDLLRLRSLLNFSWIPTKSGYYPAGKIFDPRETTLNGLWVTDKGSAAIDELVSNEYMMTFFKR